MQTITNTGQAEQTISKSRFIAVAQQCTNETEVAIFLRGLTQQHTTANHLAFAYQLKNAQGIVQRMNDAGEPSGTAGRPILQHIEGQDLVNVCIGVIRYYGGIKLGTGGLARAYGGTAKLALDDARLIPFVEMQEITLTLDYRSLDQFIRELESLNGKIIDKQFAERVIVVAVLPVDCVAELQLRYEIRRL